MSERLSEARAMVSRSSRITMLIRDLLLVPFSLAIMASSYGKWIDEPVHYLLFYACAALLVLTIPNLILALVNVRRKAYFYFNAALQILLSIALLILMVGFVLIVLNIVIIVLLRRSRPRDMPDGSQERAAPAAGS
jgi:hypothetical protein